jgi:hypothetical protein
VLILPPGHAAETLRRPRYRLNLRERWIIGGVLVAVLALTVAIVVSIGTAEHKTANGCVEVKFPTTIGGAELYRCGAQARELCRSVRSTARSGDVEGKAIAAQCRKAGLPVGT